MLDILGIKYKNPLKFNDFKQLIDNWINALNSKNYKYADSLRNELIKKNII